MTFAPGAHPKDPAQAAATRALLEALGLRPRAAAQLLGVREADVARLCAGAAHVPGAARWDRGAERWRGGWAEFAEALAVAVDAARAAA